MRSLKFQPVWSMTLGLSVLNNIIPSLFLVVQERLTTPFLRVKFAINSFSIIKNSKVSPVPSIPSCNAYSYLFGNQ